MSLRVYLLGISASQNESRGPLLCVAGRSPKSCSTYRFDLGLQLDSAEVRGVLMTEDGIECGAATFEFLGT